jgi:hypothetical protein
VNKSIVTAIIALAIGSSITGVHASEKSPYESGYDHGCDDADFRYPGDRYINQPGKGPSQHTDEFMNGYEDGFNACNDKGYEISTGFNELDEGERYGTCEENSEGNLVCDVEKD